MLNRSWINLSNYVRVWHSKKDQNNKKGRRLNLPYLVISRREKQLLKYSTPDRTRTCDPLLRRKLPGSINSNYYFIYRRGKKKYSTIRNN